MRVTVTLRTVPFCGTMSRKIGLRLSWVGGCAVRVAVARAVVTNFGGRLTAYGAADGVGQNPDRDKGYNDVGGVHS